MGLKYYLCVVQKSNNPLKNKIMKATIELNMNHITSQVSNTTVSLFNVSQKSKQYKNFTAIGFNSETNSIILEEN